METEEIEEAGVGQALRLKFNPSACCFYGKKPQFRIRAGRGFCADFNDFGCLVQSMQLAKIGEGSTRSEKGNQRWQFHPLHPEKVARTSLSMQCLPPEFRRIQANTRKID